MPIFRRWHIGPRLAARAVSFLLIYALAAWAMPNALGLGLALRRPARLDAGPLVSAPDARDHVRVGRAPPDS
jgi:hypothetical protein